MERKRKLPPRAAARSEHAAKKRTPSTVATATPSERSLTPAPSPSAPPEPAEEERPLPKSIQPGQPLPTVEKPQPDDLPHKAYQSVQERFVAFCCSLPVHSGLCLDVGIALVYATDRLFSDKLLVHAVVSLPTRFLDLVQNGSTRVYSKSTGQSRPSGRVL